MTRPRFLEAIKKVSAAYLSPRRGLIHGSRFCASESINDKDMYLKINKINKTMAMATLVMAWMWQRSGCGATLMVVVMRASGQVVAVSALKYHVVANNVDSERVRISTRTQHTRFFSAFFCPSIWESANSY